MSSESTPGWRRYFPRWARELPADLATVVLLVVVMIAVALVPVVRETPVRAALALPFVLFVPGYAFIAVLFPAAPSAKEEQETDETTGNDEVPTVQRWGSVDTMERVALSFGTSIAIVPLIGLVLNFSPWGIQLLPVLGCVGGVTVLMTFLGARRRATVPQAVRFQVPYRAWVVSARAKLFDTETRTDRVLTVLLVVSVLLAVGSVGYVVTNPKQGAAFTEFYLLTETQNGTLAADDYPTELVSGEPRTLVVGLDNHEHRSVSYTVVVEAQSVRIENNETTVLDRESLHRFSPTVADNETWQRRHQVAPTLTGDRIRLTYLLYQGDPPSDPTAENAYRDLRLWISVSEE